jgi:ribosome maturation factor RimP
LSVAQRVHELIETTVQALDVELWGVEYISQGRNSVLRVYIDSPAGIGIEDCEKVSRQVSALLDVEDPLSGEYVLEVSSPGLDRPLFTAGHYELYVGSEITVRMRGPVSGRRNFKGVIKAVSTTEVTLDCEGELVELPLAQVEKARLSY